MMLTSISIGSILRSKAVWVCIGVIVLVIATSTTSNNPQNDQPGTTMTFEAGARIRVGPGINSKTCFTLKAKLTVKKTAETNTGNSATDPWYQFDLADTGVPKALRQACQATANHGHVWVSAISVKEPPRGAPAHFLSS